LNEVKFRSQCQPTPPYGAVYSTAKEILAGLVQYFLLPNLNGLKIFEDRVMKFPKTNQLLSPNVLGYKFPQIKFSIDKKPLKI